MSSTAIDYESIAKQYGGEPAQDYASVAKQYGGEPLAPPAPAPQQDIHAIAAQHGGLPLTAAGPYDMSTVAGAIPGTKTPQQVAGVQPGLPAPTKAQGVREGWMPGETERQQVKPFTDFLNKPLLGPDTSTDQGKLAEQEAQSFRKAHPIAGGVVSGIQNTIQGMTTPANLAMLAVLPESKIISAFFAAQAAHGAYNSAEDAYQAFREGKNPEAAQHITEAGLNGLMAGLAGYHAASTHATPTSETSQPTETSQNAPRGTFPESSPETNPTTDETKPAIGEAEPETGRPVLQQSEHPEVNQAAAKAEHPIVKSQIEDAIEPIEGAEVSGARAEKTLDRIEEKIDEEGQSPKTVRDYSGYRIAVDTPEAKNQVVKALKDHFEVPDEQDEFEKGNDETGFHGHTLQVREPGSPVSHEVQILPREVADSANSRHDLYEKAREGDKDAAAQMKAANEADWQRFSERNLKGPQPMSASKTAGSVPEREAVNRNPAGDTKYQLGNTQVNIPNGSPAAKALNDFRESIPEDHLAGDGKDVGSGGNHVTVRYGIQGDDTEGIRRFIESQKPFTAKLGETDVFPPTKNSGGAVVNAKIEAPELTRLNEEIQKHGDFAPSDFPDYKPHATIAYIDPARAEEYRNSPEMKGAEFPVNSITISNRNGKQVEVPLKGTGGEDAVRVGRPEEVLQREPGQAGETGGERGRVEPIKQGEGPARAQKAGETAIQPTDREFQKGSRVRLKDGQTGTVQYFQPEVNGGQAVARVRLDSGVMRKSVQASDMRPEASEPETKGKQWIGVDLDGTLAKYDGFKGPTVIGEPIPAMVDRVRQWLAEGKNVKIMTARVSEDASGAAKRAIQDWAEKNLGQRIDVTDVKDAHMVHLYDDRAVPVERNTGRLLGQPQPEESNVVRQTTVPEGNTETTGNAERPTPEETVRRKPGERGVDTELSEARRLGKQSSDKVFADAQARNAVENISRARIETTTLKDIGNAKVTVLNPDAYHSLVKLLTPEDDWKGAALDPSTASRWIAKIRSMESRLRQLGTMKPAAEAAKALALDLDKAREADGSLLLLRSDYDEPTVREELAHRWQNKAGLRDSEAIRELTNRPEFEQINDRLKSMGYDLSPEDQASELLAKAMAGDPDMEWSLAQQKDVVSAGLKALVDEHGPSILENLPPTDPAIKSAIEEVKTYAKDKVRGNEREASERLGGERGGEARADRGQRGGTVDQGKPSAGAGGERGVQKGRAQESKLTNPEKSSLLGVLFQRVFHGSPYNFDKFTLDKIGSGEGAQAYGYGLYFASEKGVADWYRKHLSDALRANNAHSPGYLYETNIPEDENMLDWDKPLSEQSQTVEEALNSPDKEGSFDLHVDNLSQDMTGEELYRYATDIYRSAANASKQLAELGIAGIKYLDARSRGKGEGSHNYVIFDENAIEILKDYEKAEALFKREKERPETPVARFKRMSAAHRLPGEQPLPGMGEAVEKQDEAAAEQKGRAQESKLAQFKRAVDRDKESREPKGPWYLKSQKIIDQKMTGPMPADALLKMLQNNGVKPEELKWSGLEDLAKENRKVTPDEAREYIAANSLQLKEVTKGRGTPDIPPHDGTRYAGYVLPGGENYREMLLTLPERPGTPKFDPSKVEIKRHRSSATQGSTSIMYDGKLLMNYGDDPELKPNGNYEQKPDAYWMENAKKIFERGDPRNSLESRSGAFRSGHWDEPNVLGHVRFNDRTGPDGEKILHIEELQSDWHQKGRTGGYRSQADSKPLSDEETNNWRKLRDRFVMGQEMTAAENSKFQELDARRSGSPGSKVPDAPFKKTWPELLFKRMLRYAAENGYDGITWTPGEQQAERYDLSKQIDELHYAPSKDGSTASIEAYRDGSKVFAKANVPRSEWPDVIGKEIAQKMSDGEGETNPRTGYNVLSGLGLKVGSEGMKGFYDKIIPDLANKIAKPFGAKVDETKLDLPATNREAKIAPVGLGRFNVVDKDGRTLAGPFDTKTEAKDHLEQLQREASGLSVPYLPIPDAMRDSVMQGQPLFKRTETPTTVTTGKHDTGKSLDELIEDLAKAPKRSMSMEERIESASDFGLDSIAGVGDKLNQTWAKVKGSTAGIWDSWNHTSPWTNFFESLKGLRQAEFRTALDLDAYQKELKRTAPSEREREAMTIYGEAANDQELRRWASQADNLPDKRWSNAFKDATDLTPQQKAIATAHRKYYDQQLRVLTDSGLLPAGATRYVMHMFTSDPQSLHQLRSVTDFSELATDPSFLKRRVYKNYFEAIANGEKPKTLDAGLILGAYHDAFAKTFMTRSFLRSLLYAADEDDGRPLAAIQSRAGWTMLDKDQAGEARILKQPKRPEDLTGYKVIPASQLRNFTWELTDADREILAPGYKDMPKDEQAKLFGPDDPRFPVPAGKTLAIKGDLLIHPKYADRVSDLVTKSWFDRSDSKVAAALKGIQKAGALAKSVVLSGSLFHQVQLGVHAMEHLVNPFKLPELKALAKDPVVLEGVGHGLNLLSVDAEGVLSDLPGMAAYHRYLFRDYIPRLKAQMYKHAFDRNLNRYSGKLTRDEIHLMTAKQANSAFGGLDPAFFEKLNFQSNRTYKAIEHMVLFSPDFTKARAQFVAQGFGKYGQEQRMALIRGALVIYVGARIANAILNNGDAKWKPQDALSVVTPKSWGPEKRISLRTVQGDLMEVVTDPEHFSYNRINPVTLKPTIEFLTGRDNFGRQESKEHFLKDYVKQLTPIPVQKLFTTSDEGILSSLFTSAGLQTGNYRTPLEQMAHKLRIENIPDKPESEEKQDEGRRNVQMVQKIREGKATTTDLWNLVNQGKMTPREASAVMDRAQMTELQYDVHHLSLDDAMKIYAKADNSERAELHDILEEKRASGLKNMTDEAAEKVDKQLKELGIE